MVGLAAEQVPAAAHLLAGDRVGPALHDRRGAAGGPAGALGRLRQGAPDVLRGRVAELDWDKRADVDDGAGGCEREECVSEAEECVNACE